MQVVIGNHIVGRPLLATVLGLIRKRTALLVSQAIIAETGWGRRHSPSCRTRVCHSFAMPCRLARTSTLLRLSRPFLATHRSRSRACSLRTCKALPPPRDMAGKALRGMYEDKDGHRCVIWDNETCMSARAPGNPSEGSLEAPQEV